ncbi:MAG: endonuclease/exonuclease/phosphatase family protein [Flavobacteriaceae bacterium]|nr:endonuclease/exonuclease/phosphatase family protein [Flavobacteriaceae bacterium]
MFKKKKCFISFLFLFIFFIQFSHCQTRTYKIRTISFYNVENLFDTINNPNTFDDDFTSKGKNHYNSKIYWNKIENISKVISQIGFEKTKTSPAIIGLAEIENRAVLEDLINSKDLKKKQYKILHSDSPDRRGIDVALLYQKKYFTPLHHESFEVKLWDEKGKRIYTRNQLLVSGLLDDEIIYLIINHWPSRRGGQIKSTPKREKAAYITQQIINKIKVEDKNAKIFILGDFNDDPIDKSIKIGLNSLEKLKYLNDSTLYNPMENMYKKGLNTLGYRDKINLFDQILMTSNCISLDKSYSSYKFYKAGIFNPQYLVTQKGRYKGYPFRSFQNNNYTGGYSDHFPVYIYLIKENN